MEYGSGTDGGGGDTAKVDVCLGYLSGQCCAKAGLVGCSDADGVKGFCFAEAGLGDEFLSVSHSYSCWQEEYQPDLHIPLNHMLSTRTRL